MTDNRYKALTDVLKRRVLVLDGAMGTMIQSHALSEKDFRGERFENHHCNLLGNLDILSLTQPQLIADIHHAYLSAGADIISTNTFCATSISQSDYQTEALTYELNLKSARLARVVADQFSREAFDKPRFVAGVLGPGKRGVDCEQLCLAYEQATQGLLDGDVDILLLETIFDTANAKAALVAVTNVLKKRGTNVPLWISSAVSSDGEHTLAGQTVEDYWQSISPAKPFCVGFNCSLGSEALLPHLKALSKIADSLIAVYPNAGLPNKAVDYQETPTQMANILRGFARCGLVNIVGGCCGTTPEHMAAIASSISGLTPRASGELS